MHLPSESMQSTTTILHLDDHLVRKIFSHLNEFQLCTVGDVCSDFRRNARAVFSTRYLNRRFDIVTIPWKFYRMRLKRLPSTLRIFGSLIHSIDVYSDQSFGLLSRQVWQMIGQYCGESLTELRLAHFKFTVDNLSTLWPLLARLQYLEFERCTWEPTSLALIASEIMVKMVRRAPRLRELKLDRWFDGAMFDENLFMKIVDVVSARDVKCRLDIILPEIFVIVPDLMQSDRANVVQFI